MKVIAFYTPEYISQITRLIKSMDAFKISYYVEEYPSRNSWVDSCAIKPEFIQHCMNTIDDELFYVDADAEFVRPPDWDRVRTDKITVPVYKYPDRDKWELISNSIYLPNNKVTLDIVDKWVDLQKESKGEWDQITLSEILNHLDWNLLPLDYAAIDFFDIRDPVIVQHQASRTQKETFVKTQARMTDLNWDGD